ncbi:MAG: iron-containing alcohol dehydrogenase [Planctomycetaceae bacterium]
MSASSESAARAATDEAWDFVSPQRILFGVGRVAETGAAVAGLGSEAWVVAGGRSALASGGAAALEASLHGAGLPVRTVATASGEPTVAQVAAALAALPAAGRDRAVVVALGGGSTIDLAKALAALAANADDGDPEAAVLAHLEGVGRGLALGRPPLPLVAIPTTAGTGAEATRNAVISCPRRRLKKSMRSPLMVPRVAVVDPALTLSCGRATTAASGLGLAHGVAAALGVECGAPHGAACALMLPVALRVNRDVAAVDLAMLERAVDPRAARDDGAAADAFLARIESLCAVAGTPRRLRDVGLAADRVGWLAAHSGGASMRGNPEQLDEPALRAVLEAAW